MAQVISDEQLALNRELHANNSDFGNRADGAGLAGNLGDAIKRLHEIGICNSVLDYGTGKGKMVESLRQKLPKSIEVAGYDPAVKSWEVKPNHAYDIVTCLDVLEHIEISYIGDVLKDIKALTRRFCYLVIDLQPAVKTLKDGRNAHILLAPSEWWVGRIAQLYSCQASFPIMHSRGIPQKLIIAATDEPTLLPIIYGFLTKLKLFDIAMSGGPLGSSNQRHKAS